MAELNYEFKKRLGEVHKKNRRIDRPLAEGEIEVTAAWTVVVPADNAFLQRVGRDLQDYFFTSMGVEVGYSTVCPVRRAIVYEGDETKKGEGSYRVEVTPSRIRLIRYRESRFLITCAPILQITGRPAARAATIRSISSSKPSDVYGSYSVCPGVIRLSMVTRLCRPAAA